VTGISSAEPDDAATKVVAGMTTRRAVSDPRAAQAPDYDEIARVMHIYTDSWGKGDPGVFEEAFFDDAWMFYTEADGTLVRKHIWGEFEHWAAEKIEVTCRIISMVQAGDVANVLLGFDITGHLDDSWVDMHNLIRVNGVWKITNKTATHTSRAGGA
jgi:hypothetical protein